MLLPLCAARGVEQKKLTLILYVEDTGRLWEHVQDQMATHGKNGFQSQMASKPKLAIELGYCLVD